jgi:xanthine dehydrogenase accessory factor
MVISAEETWGSIGGGNVEAVAVNRARALLAESASEPTTFTANLSDKAPVEHGVQCCGGEVTVLLDPLPVLPAVAIFGVGHVGLELARILARHELDLHLIDSMTHSPRSPTRLRESTHTTYRCCPSWCSASCRSAPTCW